MEVDKILQGLAAIDGFLQDIKQEIAKL